MQSLPKSTGDKYYLKLWQTQNKPFVGLIRNICRINMVDMLIQLVADPSDATSSARQNPPICHRPLYMVKIPHTGDKACLDQCG